MDGEDEKPGQARAARRTLIERRIGRERWTGLGVIGGITTVAVVVPAAQAMLRWSDVGTFLLFISGFVVVGGGIAAWVFASRWRREQLAECDCQRCLYCFHDLRGIGVDGACPECGAKFSIDEVRETWREEFFKGTTGEITATSARTSSRIRRRQSLLIVVLICLVGWPLVMRLLNGLFSWWDVAAIVLIAGIVASRVFDAGRAKRTRDMLAACDYRCCLSCKFDLRGLPESGKCPECGEQYEIEDVRKWWKDAWEIP